MAARQVLFPGFLAVCLGLAPLGEVAAQTAPPPPAFSKSFSPDTLNLGERSTLTYVIDNAAPDAADVRNITFSDAFPDGLVVADPANVVVGPQCIDPGIFGPVNVTASPNSQLFSFSAADVTAGAVCTVSLDVVTKAVGTIVSTSGNLTALNASFQTIDSGPAVSQVTAVGAELLLTQDILGDPVPAGGTVVIEYRVQNFNRAFTAVGVNFTNTLDATLTGLSAIGSPQIDGCGAGAQVVGTSLIGLSGASVPPGGSCVVSLTLQIPAGAPTNSYPNTTSVVRGSINGSDVTGNTSTETLFVQPGPILTKTFLTNPVGSGGAVDVEYSITNSSNSELVTDLAFTDAIGQFISGATATSLPAAGFCGAGSTAFVSQLAGSPVFSVQGANLAANASCTFQFTLQLPAGGNGGDFVGTTSLISGKVGGEMVSGAAASDTLTVVVAPFMQKSFVNDPVGPGDTVTVEFTLSHDSNAPAAATGINFTDDFAAVVAGLQAIGLPQNDVCGAGSQLSGTASIGLTGGTLNAGDSCSFSVTLQVPGAATPGVFTSTTSGLFADVNGVAVQNLPASDDLLVSGVEFTKRFLSNPVQPGEILSLEFSITNSSPSDALSGLFFSDNLSAVLSGLTAVGLPVNDVCGSGSQFIGTTNVILSGGNLQPGESCTFSVAVQVPGNAVAGEYSNVTSQLSGTFGGSNFSVGPAIAPLSVVAPERGLALSKRFLNDPVPAGGTVIIEYTVTSASNLQSESGISFDDELISVVPGLSVTGLPINDVCGAGSSFSGGGIVSLVDGQLPPLSSCTFQVTAQVPVSATPGDYLSTTTAVRNAGITGNAASDTLTVQEDNLDLSVSISNTVDEVVKLNSYDYVVTVNSLDPDRGVNDATVLLPLPAGASGVSWTCTPSAGSVCTGAGSGAINDGISMPIGGSVVYNLAVSVADTSESQLDLVVNVEAPDGRTDIQPANNSATESDPIGEFTLGKVFVDSPAQQGRTIAVSYTVSNNTTGSASQISFSDDLSGALAGLVAVDLPLNDVCGAGSTVSGSSLVTLSGGSLPAGQSCTFDINVTIPQDATPGAYPGATQPLSSNEYQGNAATDTLSVLANSLDVAVTITNNVDQVLELGMADYVVTVTNEDTVSPAEGVLVDLPLPTPVASAEWGCAPSGGAVCNAAGSGAINELVDLPVGGSVVFTWTATLTALACPTLDVGVTVSAPAGLVDVVPGNNTANDEDPVLGQTVFNDGFEG